MGWLWFVTFGLFIFKKERLLVEVESGLLG
jgi:hypothetical protein